MPNRNIKGQYVQIKKESIEIANKYEPLHVYQKTRFYFNNLFYVSNTKNKLFDKQEKIMDGHYYVMDSASFLLHKNEVVKLDSIIDGAHQYQYFIVQKRD